MNAATSKLIRKISLLRGVPRRAIKRAWNDSNARGRSMLRKWWSAEVSAMEAATKITDARERQAEERRKDAEFARQLEESRRRFLSEALEAAEDEEERST